MSAGWFYRINGFELGPVPPAEIRRLLQKGRIAPDTPARHERGGDWVTVERAVEPDDASIPHRPGLAEPWHILLLERFAIFGIPIGIALSLPWGRLAPSVGVMALTPFAVALIRLLVGIARDLGAIRREIAAITPRASDRPAESPEGRPLAGR